MSATTSVTRLPTREDLHRIPGWQNARIVWRGPRGLAAYAIPSTGWRDRGRYLGVFDMSEEMQQQPS